MFRFVLTPGKFGRHSREGGEQQLPAGYLPSREHPEGPEGVPRGAVPAREDPALEEVLVGAVKALAQPGLPSSRGPGPPSARTGTWDNSRGQLRP